MFFAVIKSNKLLQKYSAQLTSIVKQEVNDHSFPDQKPEDLMIFRVHCRPMSQVPIKCKKSNAAQANQAFRETSTREHRQEKDFKRNDPSSGAQVSSIRKPSAMVNS